MRWACLCVTFVGWLCASASGVGHDAAGAMVLRLAPEERPASMRVPAYFDDLDAARLDLDAGLYRRVIWAQPAGREGDLLRARALVATGNTHAARELAARYDDADALVVLGDALFKDRDFAAAVDAYAAAVEVGPARLVPRQRLGHAHEAAGDYDAARAAYAWFRENDTLRRFFADRDAFDDAAELVALGTAADRLATLEARYAPEPGLHDDVLAVFVYAYDVVDRGNVDARLAAARFLFERSDHAAGGEELEAAAARRPFGVDVWALAGDAQLERFGFAAAQQAVDNLRRADPRSRHADVLEARSLMLQRQATRALPAIDRLVTRDASDVEALGLLAAARAMRLEADASADALARADAVAPHDPTAYLRVGEQLARTRQYDRAADALGEAVRRAPWSMHARNELAALYVQAGREADAVRELEAAVAIDPFNASTANYLSLLRELAGYDRRETAHFVVRHDSRIAPQDALVAHLMSDWLDAMHDDISAIYGHTPRVTTDIQVFPTHDRFSVRVAGDPYVGTVGACTGPVIALVAPRDDPRTLGAFDWARVMRHEYVHTVTLDMTGNRVWHWLTEGLAVRDELAPPAEAQMTLLAAATQGRGDLALFGVEDLTWGFVRPRKDSDRAQAYAQSWMAVEYFAHAYGPDAPARILDASGRGLTEREALAELFDTTPDAFDAGFAVWMADTVASWGHDGPSSARHADAVLRGNDALARRDNAAALAAFEEAHAARPMDESPMRRLAALYLLEGRRAEAAGMFDALAARTTTDARLARRAAELWLDLGEHANAVASAKLAVFGDTYNRDHHALLLRAARSAGDDVLVARQTHLLEMYDALVSAE